MKRSIVKLGMIAILGALAGCASVTDVMSKAAGLGVVSVEHSTFDNATVVSVTPTFLYNPARWGNQIKLGARWSSALPNNVVLVFAYDSNILSASTAYLGITGVDINIDGAIRTYSTSQPTSMNSSAYNSISKTIYTSSSNAVVIPYEMLQQMVSAKDCRLRIHTTDGYEDSQFSIERIPGGQGTALLAIKQFMARVTAVRAGG